MPELLRESKGYLGPLVIRPGDRYHTQISMPAKMDPYALALGLDLANYLDLPGRASDIVCVDASFDDKDGSCGLAVVGALGTHSRRVVGPTNSLGAEREAMRLAWNVAGSLRRYDLVFCTDCDAIARSFPGRPTRGWETTWIPRRLNAYANLLARTARRGGSVTLEGRLVVRDPDGRVLTTVRVSDLVFGARPDDERML